MSQPPPRLTLVLGGARSGKSAYAEGLVMACPQPWLYLATAEIWDDEMAERVALHRARRPQGWITRDVPLALPEAVAAAEGPVLVDCLTLWLTNLILKEADVAEAGERLAAACTAAAGPVVLVTNEVGLGIVPDHPLGRAFRDAAGRLHQQVAAVMHDVYFVVAGRVLSLQPFPYDAAATADFAK